MNGSLPAMLGTAASYLAYSLYITDPVMTERMEENAFLAFGDLDYAGFSILAMAREYSPDVRGAAARLYVELLSVYTDGDTPDENETLCEDKFAVLKDLANSKTLLVRLGVVMGLDKSHLLKDARVRSLLAYLSVDRSSRVRTKVKRLLVQLAIA